jgi:hypothetical protein
MAGRSAMNRPIQSCRHHFPTRTLPAGAPLPGRPTAATPSSAQAGNASALMLDAGTTTAAPAPSQGGDVQLRPTPGAPASGSRSGGKAPSQPPKPSSSKLQNGEPPIAPTAKPPIHRPPVIQPPTDGDFHV